MIQMALKGIKVSQFEQHSFVQSTENIYITLNKFMKLKSLLYDSTIWSIL